MINLKLVIYIPKIRQRKQYRLCTRYKELNKRNHRKRWKINKIMKQIQEIEFVLLLQVMNNHKNQKVKNYF